MTDVFPEVTDEEWAAEQGGMVFDEVDWDRAFDETPEDVEWLVEPVLEAGALAALFSPPKEGKSLFTLELAASMASGRPFLNEAGGRSRHVLYVDFENRPKDFVDRLKAMKFEPSELKGWLHYLTFPTMAALDTEEGGAQLHANAVHFNAELVIIDTVSRVIDGGENDADTFKEMYRHSLSRLKRDGIACIRLDHTGKNAEAGQRGSSAKNADVDVVWRLSLSGKTQVRLVREYSRQHHYPGEIRMNRVTDPYLRHETDLVLEMEAMEGGATPREVVVGDGQDPAVTRAIDELNRWGVPLDMGRPKIREQYKEIKASDRILGQAIKARRMRG